MLQSEYMRDLLYDLLNVFGGVMLIIFNLTQFNKKKNILSNVVKKCQNRFTNMPNSNVWIIIEIIFISLLQFAPAGFLNFRFGSLVRTGANYFGLLFFIPIILTIFCYIIWINPLKQIDLITPAFPLALIFVKIGCFCSGCCHGFDWENGLYNYVTRRTQFPIQLLEALIALLIFIFLLFWRKRAKTGTMFPTYIIVYSGIRFFSEFLSGKVNILWIFKRYHIICFIGLIVGVVELLLVLKYGDKINEHFEGKPYEVLKIKFNELKEKVKQRKETNNKKTNKKA